jgi:multidrug efflux pump subunit AcrB
MGASSPIDIEIRGGSDPKEVEEFARKVREAVATVRGAADVRIGQRLDAPYRIIKVDRMKAAAVGLTAQDVILQVVAAMNSSVSISRNFWIDTTSNNQYFVAVQYADNPSMQLGDILNVFATGTRQPNAIKLSSLAVIDPKEDAVEINHVSLYRTFNVYVNTENRDIGSVARDVKKKLARLTGKFRLTDKALRIAGDPKEGGSLQKVGAPKALVKALAPLKDQDFRRRALFVASLQKVFDEAGQDDEELGKLLADKEERERLLELVVDHANVVKPFGVQYELKGEYGRMVDTAWGLGGGLLAAFVLVYLLQVALFRSWVGPFIIMFTVPLGMIGVFIMLFVTGTTLNVQSAMGTIFLIGIEVNTGVLMIEFANNQRKLGMPVQEAIVTAAKIRFRPILMTFLAAFLALTPMALGLERGSEANVPLARAVVGGLLSSTLLGRFVLPVLYVIMMRDPLPPEVDIDADLASEGKKEEGGGDVVGFILLP